MFQDSFVLDSEVLPYVFLMCINIGIMEKKMEITIMGVSIGVLLGSFIVGYC